MRIEAPLQYLESRTFDEINVGDCSSLVRTLRPEDIQLFAVMSGDVNPAIVEAQVNGAVALGLSQTLLEEAVYVDGKPRARNYDLYPILPPSRMAKVHVKIVESGEKMGGIGEPPLPAVAPAVVNAVAQLTGQRVRSLPLSRHTFS